MQENLNLQLSQNMNMTSATLPYTQPSESTVDYTDIQWLYKVPMLVSVMNPDKLKKFNREMEQYNIAVEESERLGYSTPNPPSVPEMEFREVFFNFGNSVITQFLFDIDKEGRNTVIADIYNHSLKELNTHVFLMSEKDWFGLLDNLLYGIEG